LYKARAGLEYNLDNIVYMAPILIPSSAGGSMARFTTSIKVDRALWEDFKRCLKHYKLSACDVLEGLIGAFVTAVERGYKPVSYNRPLLFVNVDLTVNHINQRSRRKPKAPASCRD